MCYCIYEGERKGWNVKFGEIIKKEREKQNLLQKELADILKISQSFLSDIERNNRMPDFDLACFMIYILQLDCKSICMELKSIYMSKKIL